MTWSKILLVVVGLPVVGLVAFAGWVWVSFSGGLDDVLDVDHPQAGDPEVVAAEEAARSDLVTVTHEVERTLVESVGDPMADRVGGGVASASCEVGQHNVKIDDDFDLACTLLDVGVVAAPGVPDARAAALQVDAALHRDGWRSAHPDGLGVAAEGDLPPLRYTRQRHGQTWHVLVDEADLSTLTYELRGHDSRGLRDTTGRQVWVEQLVSTTSRKGYAVVVGVGVEYFRD